VYWVQVGVLGFERPDVKSILAIGMDDDGMPVPPGGAPPSNLVGKDLAFYRGLMDRARAHTREHLRLLRDDAIDAVRTSPT